MKDHSTGDEEFLVPHVGPYFKGSLLVDSMIWKAERLL